MTTYLPRLFVALLLVSSLVAAQSECASHCSSQTMKVSVGNDIVDTAIAAGSFKTLVTALKAADLVGALRGKGPFTVFAPTDAAFAKLPEGTVANLLKPENRATLKSILTYHVVAGSSPAASVVKASSFTTLNGQRAAVAAGDAGASIAGSRIVKTDIRCSNGIIHVIDSVMMPASKNIVETAQAAGSFTTLLTAATKAGLAGTLADGGPFTVFAPTDAAFAKLPKGTIASLLKPENRAKLAAILKYHVVSGRVFASDVVTLDAAKSISGKTLPISTRNGVRVAGANVVKTDIQTSNGVIHVIDAVMLPK